MAVQPGDYGPVLILRGPYEGRVGYYDDDDSDSDDDDAPDDAVVYLGEPFDSDYILIPHAQLEKVAAKSIHLERWKRRHPWLVKYVGVP